MASKSVSQTLRDDFLTCKVCFGVYQSPKILPCHHTYCKGCIAQLIQQDGGESFHCPECRRVTPVHNGDPDSLPVNFFVSGLLETFTVDHCFVCKLRGVDNPASHQCLDCGDILCLSCASGHLASRSTINHRLVTLEDIASGNYDAAVQHKKQVFCGEHPNKECAVYCRTCKKPMCISCALVVHKEHELSSLEEGSTDAKDSAADILGKSQEMLKDLGTLWTRVHKQIKETTERKQGTLGEVEIAAEQIIQAIIAQKDETLMKLQTGFDEELERYSSLKEEVDTVGKNGRQMVDSLHVMVRENSSSQMLMVSDTWRQGLQQLQNSYQSLAQRCYVQPELTFTVNTAIYENPAFSICRVGENRPSMKMTKQPTTDLKLTTPVSGQAISDYTVKSPKKHIHKSNGDLTEITQFDEVPYKQEIVDPTAKLKQALQNIKILDPPTAIQNIHPQAAVPAVNADPVMPANSVMPANPVMPANLVMPTSPRPIPTQPSVANLKESPRQKSVPVSPDPSFKSYSDVLKIASSHTSPYTKVSRISLTFKARVNVSVKKDENDTEIAGISFFLHDRVLITDRANKKVKSFVKDGTAGFLKEFKKDGYAPSSITAIKDVIVFSLQNVVHIVTKQYVPIAKISLGSCATSLSVTENMPMFPLCKFDEESFIVSNLHGNKQWVIKLNGELVKEMQCPAKSPVVAVSRDDKQRFLYSSWGQPGSVVVTDVNLKRLMVLQPLEDGHPLDTWYPGYSACDLAGNFFVADPYRNRISAFNQQGHEVVSFDTTVDNLLEPLCLIIDRTDTMYVTGKNKDMVTYKIKRKKAAKTA